jgi:hypothetical protein
MGHQTVQVTAAVHEDGSEDLRYHYSYYSAEGARNNPRSIVEKKVARPMISLRAGSRIC